MRVLVINCYFPELRIPIKLPFEIPNSVVPVFLAGHFSPERCEVRLYNEITEGFLEWFHPELLSWPDMVVFTGLTNAFDRMLQISAYVRALNPRVITVAGGHAIRAVPRFSKPFFDYTTTGDVEDIKAIIVDALGEAYVAEAWNPRYDIAPWIGRIGYVESTRNCNFRCSFCSLTAEARGHAKQSTDYLRRQIVALGKRDILCFQDNQFYSLDKEYQRERFDVMAELRDAGHFQHWHAFVTNTFLWDDEMIADAKRTGCFSLFIGVEAFDEKWLRSVNKMQNNKFEQVKLISKCLDAGIQFQYGLVFDPTERRVEDMHREVQFICDHADVPPPNFIFMATPYPGTPFFRDRLERGMILPGTKLRDLEGSTLTLKPQDDIDLVAHFVRTTKNFRDYRSAAIRHQAKFLWRYRKSLSWKQSLVSTIGCASILSPANVSNPLAAFRRQPSRTHVSTTDRLDCVYHPTMSLPSALERNFEPTYVTNHAGEVNDALGDDLLATRYKKSGTTGQ